MMGTAVRILIPIAVLLSGCGNQGADGYTFGSPTFTKPTVQVSVVLLPSRKTVEAEFRERNPGRPSSEVVAFSALRADGCTIYAVDPAVDYQPEYIGHELVHCFYGEWHK